LQCNNAREFFLEVSVSVEPDGVKDQYGLEEILVKEWKLAKSALKILKGMTDRN
jgi:uncharacterized protein YggU (UPF0235/DUF167 family)